MSTPPATILIVDDEPQNRKLLEALLRPEGYLTQSVAGGKEALAAIRERSPDLILLDVMMPGMDGHQVARLLKANTATATIPIIMVTAQTDRSARLAGLDAGAEEFLTKPVDRAELWLRVRNLLRLKTLGDFYQNHMVILDQQVQARTVELQRFRTAMDVTADAIFLVNRGTMRFMEVNATCCAMMGYTREELLQTGPVQLSPNAPGQIERVYDALIAGDDGAELRETKLSRKDQSPLLVEVRRTAHHDGTDWIIVGVMRDITERKKAELRILHLNRVYAVLSGINTLIVRVNNRAELFREACRIAIEMGEFLVADVMITDPVSGKLELMASSSADPRYLENRTAFLAALPQELGDSVTQIYTHQKALILNDVDTFPALFSGRDVFPGILSVCVLPLVMADQTVGLFVLRSREAGFFDAAEMKLLLELAGDISFALSHLEKAAKLDYLAYFNQLTGLANAALFRERFGQSLRASGEARHVALALLDVERFKTLNDALGRVAGDALLKQIASRLTRCTGSADDLAHFSADHFAVILPDMGDGRDVARRVTECLDACFSEPFTIAGVEFKAAAKVGIALYPTDGVDPDILFRNAEAALRQTKASGDRYLFYSEEMNARVAERLTLETRLRWALEREQFVLHYQPKVVSATGRIVGVEALIRWNDPENGLIPPVEFIPMLEETGLIREVGSWALRRAVRDHGAWTAAGLVAPRIAVNVSEVQLRQADFVGMVRESLAAGPIPPGIDLEITESLIMKDIGTNISKLQAIRDIGVNIAIDDFGTGYSSLAYLARLPIQVLKIDRSFVITMLADPNIMILVSTIITLAHSLGLTVVAEGVDREEQAAKLRLLRCDQMQGYLFGKPVPFDEISALIAAG